MTNVIKFGRKVLTMGTVFSTILWSVGVSALVPAMAQAQTSCPAFQPGDMIKVTGRPAIYSVDAGGKVLYFPSGDEFKSWNTGETYGGYTSVSQSCFDSLPVPTMAPLGVNFRPGSYVVKRPSSDQLYVVEPGNMLAPISASAASALYGASYKVKTVADVFWPNYGNTRGAAVTEAKAHPGMLVSNGGKTYFVDSTGALREVTAAGFTANRFKTAFVHPIASTAGYTMGSQVTAFEAAVTDRTQTGVANSGTTPTSSGAVTVSLAADNPAGTILASGTAFNPVLKLNLTAGSQAVSITGLTIRKSGLASNTVVNGADVIDSSGVRHGNVASTLTSDNDLILLFSGSPINVPANSTQTVTIRVNIASSATSGTLQFSVVGPAGVAGATAGGSFPVSGNVFQIQSGSAAISAVTVTTTVLGDANVNVDTTNEQDVTKFSIQETSSQENVKLSNLTVYNAGTAADSDVQDVQLVAQDGTVLATAQQVGKYVNFNLVSPYVVDKGTTKYVTIRAKIVGQTGRTIQFLVYNNYDIVLVGANTGAKVLPTGVFPTQSFNTLTIQKGTLSFNKDVSSPSAAITPASNGVVLAKYFAKPTGEDMELRTVSLTINSSTPILTGSLTIKVNGSAVWSGSAFGGTSALTLSSYPVMAAGQNSYITVEGNIMSGVTNGATTTVSMDLTQVRRLVTNDIIDPGVNSASGNTLSVQAASLRVTNLATPVAQSVVAGASNVTLANIELSGIAVSSGEDLKVSKLVISDSITNSGTSTDLGNLVLYDANGNALVTTASTNVNAASNTFSFATPVVVPKTGSVTLTLKGDVLTGTAGTHTFLVGNAADVTATGVTTGNSLSNSSITVAGSGQGMTVATAGTLTLSVVTGGTAAPASDQTVIAGTTGVPVFAFKMTAQKEAIKVSSLVLTATGTLNTVNDLTNVKLSTSVGGTAFATVAQGVSGATGITFTFGGTGTDNLLAAAIQPGTPVTVYVTADVQAGGISRLGDKFKFSLASSTLVAKGAASGASATVSGAPAVSALTYIEPFNVNVAATDPTSPITTLAAGSRIGTFKITNNGSSQITITGIKFTNSGSTSTGPFALYYSSQNSSDYLNTAASTTFPTVDFSSLATTFTIDGGAYRYVSVVSNKTAVSGDSYQLSIANVGDVTFSASEANLGYDYNADGDLADNATGLVAADRATLATISKP